MGDQSKQVLPRWLLLLYQLPTRPSKARVKTWRRLQQVGAIPVRNSAYALPNSPQPREDFEWIKSEILSMGGQAAVFAAEPADAVMNGELVAAFRAARDEEYNALSRQLAVIERRVRAETSRGGRGAPAAGTARAVRACRGRFTQVVATDFFASPARRETEKTLAALEARMMGTTSNRHETEPHLDVAAYRNRTWVTRPDPGVDRMATAWLIRTFVDPMARFAFAEKPSRRQVPFDMYAGEFSHHGGLCTFEVLVDRFAVADPAVRRIGEIVHDIDLKDARFQPPEAATVGALVEGLRRCHVTDDTALQRGMDLFEALYCSMTAVPDAARARRRKRRQRDSTRRRLLPEQPTEKSPDGV